MKFKQILTSIFFLLGLVAYTQQSISGIIVTDESGVPLPGMHLSL